MRKEIESSFDMHAVDIYGLSEVMGPGVANECVESKDGLHIWEDHFFPEIIDPTTGEVLEEGEQGELVFTSLTKEAFPIIRYRTKDLTRLFQGTARSMRRMEKVTGRSDDLMIIRGVNVFPSQIEENILEFRELSPHFQIELTRRDRLDEMLVRVELSNLGDWSKRNEYEKFLSKKIKNSLGITTTVSIEQKGLVARSEGKATRVVDNRKLY